jgi:hypothetical protein
MKISLSIIFLVLHLLNFAHANQDENTCFSKEVRTPVLQCFDPVLSQVPALTRIAGLAIPEVVVGDYRTPFKTIIGQSCLAHIPEDLKRYRLDIFQNAIKRALTQSELCYEMFGFEELREVLERIPKVSIECPKQKQSGEDAEIDFAKGLFALSFYRTDILDDRKVAAYATKQIASTIVHEVLHTSANNRGWHTRVNEQHRFTDPSCETSLYNDRIYLIQGVCFQGRGHFNMLHVINECPHLCEDALTQVDPEIEELFAKFHFNKEALASTYPKKAAKEICQRVREFVSHYAKYEEIRNYGEVTPEALRALTNKERELVQE